MTANRAVLALVVCSFAIVAFALGVCILQGPRLEKSSQESCVCSVCGQEKCEAAVLGLTYRSERRETDLSKWYWSNGLPPHSHRWETTDWTVRYWDGTYFSPSFDYCANIPLQLLREAVGKVDRATAEELKDDYRRAQSNESAASRFANRCWTILQRQQPGN